MVLFFMQVSVWFVVGSIVWSSWAWSVGSSVVCRLVGQVSGLLAIGNFLGVFAYGVVVWSCPFEKWISGNIRSKS